MVSWFATVMAAWLLLSFLVCLGLARVMSLSGRSAHLISPSTVAAHPAFPIASAPVRAPEAAQEHRQPVAALGR